ncbi:MAG: DUF4920 domain-containing protein [Myxococcales bacterium]|nr:DUF4920 domain-containing protein [Myxococcales bacterium]
MALARLAEGRAARRSGGPRRSRVDRVCAKKGCWMVLAGGDGAPDVRITFRDYGFFVPSSAVGRTGVVRGLLEAKELSREQAQHYEDDRVEGTGEAPVVVEGPVRELSIVANALELRPAS